MATTKTTKAKTTYAEKGVSSSPVNDTAEIINSVNVWAMETIKDDDEAEQRIGEYFNLCAEKGEMPMFETMCLYLGISDDKGKAWVQGDGCSTRMQTLIQNALTVLKAVEGKAVYAGKIRDVPYIWRSKQYFGYREPNSKLEDILAGNLLKELPSTQNIAQRYLEDIEESEEPGNE